MKEKFHTDYARFGMPLTEKELASQAKREAREAEQKKLSEEALFCDFYMRPLKVGDEVIHSSNLGMDRRKIEEMHCGLFRLAKVVDGFESRWVFSSELKLVPLPESPDEMPVNPNSGMTYC